ncbi:MAG TPA: hypothetical protein VGX91_11945 [Candidatus Cybelea sp.]|nr:hypothetical protein [Candidatus Cybelea sp.]
MNRGIFALAFALSVLPLTALAADSNAAPPTDQQRQAMHQTLERFAQQEEQLHQQMRSQILASLSPVHRRAVAAEIGNLAVSENPDPDATAKRIDAILGGGERQRIIEAHQAFANQSRQLHDQLKQQMESMMPAGGPPHEHPPMDASMRERMNDAGWIVLHALPPHDDMHGPMDHIWH